MSAVNEMIVREYFETLGFLVSQPRKYVPTGRRRKADEEIDFIVVNPTVREQTLPVDMIWKSADLATIARGVVSVRGWHTDIFSAAKFVSVPEILRFAEPAPVRAASIRLGGEPIAKILCLTNLPTSGDLKNESIRVLREKGIDGVLSFQTMLLELIAFADISHNYEKSDVLQMLRLLKSYHLLKDAQMDLFEGRRRRKRAPPLARSEE